MHKRLHLTVPHLKVYCSARLIYMLNYVEIKLRKCLNIGALDERKQNQKGIFTALEVNTFYIASTYSHYDTTHVIKSLSVLV